MELINQRGFFGLIKKKFVEYSMKQWMVLLFSLKGDFRIFLQ